MTVYQEEINRFIKKIFRKIFFSKFAFKRIKKAYYTSLRKTITVLMYHGVCSESETLHSSMLLKTSKFDKQLKYLTKNFDLISLNELRQFNKKHIGIKPKAVLTFDDGMDNNFTFAYPVLYKYGSSATIYVTTNPMMTGKSFWWNDIIEHLESQKNTIIDLRNEGIGIHYFDQTLPKNEYGRRIDILVNNIKSLKPNYRKKIIIEILKNRDIKNKEINRVLAPISPENLKELSASPLITIGSHSHYHHKISELEYNEKKKEIIKSLKILKLLTGKQVNHFAYPYGNFDCSINKILSQNNITTGATTETNRWRSGMNMYLIPRIGINGYITNDNFKKVLFLPKQFLKLI